MSLEIFRLDWSKLKLVFAIPWCTDNIRVRKFSKKCWWESLLQLLVSTILLEAGLPAVLGQFSYDFGQVLKTFKAGDSAASLVTSRAVSPSWQKVSPNVQP